MIYPIAFRVAGVEMLIPPAAADMSALDVGMEGNMAGVDRGGCDSNHLYFFVTRITPQADSLEGMMI
jgi:hypothetical protein